MFSQTSNRLQLVNRLNTLLQCPGLFGRRRHWAPARKIHSIASTNRRQVPSHPMRMPGIFFKPATSCTQSSSLSLLLSMSTKKVGILLFTTSTEPRSLLKTGQAHPSSSGCRLMTVLPNVAYRLLQRIPAGPDHWTIGLARWYLKISRLLRVPNAFVCRPSPPETPIDSGSLDRQEAGRRRAWPLFISTHQEIPPCTQPLCQNSWLDTKKSTGKFPINEAYRCDRTSSIFQQTALFSDKSCG